MLQLQIMGKKAQKKARSKTVKLSKPLPGGPSASSARDPGTTNVTPLNPTSSEDGEGGPQDPTALLRSLTALSLSTPANGSDSDTTREVSKDPYIVMADVRVPGGAYFLYMPPEKRDIVFIDTPAMLREVAQWDVWKRPAPTPPRGPACAVAAIPQKGQGLVATRAIKAGELVVAERPVFVLHNGLPRAADQSENGVFHANALRRLSAASASAIYALTNAYPPDKAHPLSGTLATNYLQLDATPEPMPGSADEYVGCFPLLSRVNHDCTPSANYFFSFPTFSGQLWATRDIAAGEEITMSYCVLSQTRDVRRAYLRERYFFDCTCETCSLPASGRKKSDERRRKVNTMIEKVELGNRELVGRISANVWQETVRCAEEEKLLVHRAQLLFYGAGAMAAGRANPRLVSRWMVDACDAYRLVEGEQSYNVLKLTALASILSPPL
jgi:hypothetical protein